MDRDRLIDQTGRDARLLRDRESGGRRLVNLAVLGGVVGLLFVVPVVAGAYAGRWLDSLGQGYSVRWTVSLIVIGIGVGTYNAWQYMSKRT